MKQAIRKMAHNPKITLRPRSEHDTKFLFDLYVSTRLEEIAVFGWPEAQVAAFLEMQFQAQESAFGLHDNQAIILHDGQAVGRIIVTRSEAEIQLVDIALLADYRRWGIGTGLIGELQKEGAESGVPVTLHVLVTNIGARRLYERLGFLEVDNTGSHYRMSWATTTN